MCDIQPPGVAVCFLWMAAPLSLHVVSTQGFGGVDLNLHVVVFTIPRTAECWKSLL